MTYVITRPIGGICLNGKECILDGDGEVMVFETKHEAWGWLYGNNIDKDEADRQDIQVEADEEEVVEGVDDDCIL